MVVAAPGWREGSWAAFPVLSGGGHGPSGCSGVDFEHGEAGQVVGDGEEGEVGVDLDGAAHPGSSSTVFAGHQVPEFAFHFGSGRPVAGDPGRVLLLLAGISQALLVATDPDPAAIAGSAALRP